MALSKNIQEEAWLSTQVEDIKDEAGAIFKARSEAAEDKVDKVDKAKLLKLLAKEVVKIGFFTIPTI